MLDLLRPDHDGWRARVESNRGWDRGDGRHAMSAWLRDPVFAPVRGASIDALPEPERAAWRRFWWNAVATHARTLLP